MRLPLRSLSTLLLGVGVATCSDAPHAPLKQTSPGKGRLALNAVFSPRAAAIYAQRATFAEVTFDHVRIVLTRPPNEVVKDTVVTFDPTSPPKTLELVVDVRFSGEVFDGLMEYTNNGVVVYRGTVRVQSHEPGEPPPTGSTLVLDYVGPGANATRLVVAPATIALVSPGTTTFTATAFDANNTAIPNPPVTWTSSDPTVLTINASTGAAATTGKRGTVTVTGRMPTTISGTASVSVTLPASTITLVSGGGQTGKAGAALAQPAVVQVSASDGVGVAGVTVNFAAPAGGSVGSSSATTDANGRASTSLTLGGALGPQSFAATAAGFSVSIGATATAGDPAAIQVVSGSGQVDTVRRALRAPFVVRVTDRFGNGVIGVTVSWARTAGAGSLGGASSVTGTDGQASMGYTLGSTVGQETVTASVSGVAAGASFTATALAAAPAAIVIVSGNQQAARIGQALTLSVRVTDDVGNPVANIPVNWTATNGTIPPASTTDAQGLSTNTLTLGNTVGAASATATVGSGAAAKSVTFTATVQTGFVARLVFRAAPPAGTVGQALTPAIQIELRDAGNNLTAAANPVTIALGSNAAGAVLGGTLTRTSAAGVATFDNLTLDKAGTFTLVASSAGVPSVTSAAFNVTAVVAGPAATLRFVDGTTFAPLAEPPNYTVVAGGTISNPAAVKVTDANGVAVPNTAVTVQVTAGETLIFAGTPVTNTQGILTFASMGIPAPAFQTAGTYVIRLSSGNANPIAFTVTVTPGPPAALKYQSKNPISANANAALSPPLVVLVVDAYGNRVPTAADNISVAITPGTGTSGAILGGTTTLSAEGGSVAFSTLTIDRAGSGYTLTATAAGRTSDVSGPISIGVTGSQSRLAITTQPALTVQNRATIGSIVVQLQDASGTAVAVPGVVVSAALQSAPSGGQLTGTRTATTNASGQATFNALALQGLIGNYTIQFSSGTLTPTSVTFTNTPGAPVAQQWVQQPPFSAIATQPFAVRVGLYDADNNLATNAPASQTQLAITTGTGTSGAVLTGGGAVSVASGVAIFTNLSINLAGTGYRLTAANTLLASAPTTSNLFDITPAPNGLAVVTMPPSFTNDVVWSPAPAVRLVNGTTNVALAGVTVTVTFQEEESDRPPLSESAARRRRLRAQSRSQMAPPVVTGNTAVTDVNGVATFTALKYTGTLASLSMTFTATGPGVGPLVLVTDAPTMNRGVAAGLVHFEEAAQVGPINTPLSQRSYVFLVDAGGNEVSGPPTLVTFTPAAGSGTVNPTSATTDVEGVASTQWTMPGAPGPVSMTASATFGGVTKSVTFTATAVSAIPAGLVPIGPALITTPAGAGTSLPPSNYPQVQAVDNAQRPLANVDVDFTPIGACTAPGGQSRVRTDANGVAALTPALLTFSSVNPASCRIFVSAPGIGTTVVFNIIALPAGMKTFTGANPDGIGDNRDWANPDNWLPVGIPVSTDNVFIPGYTVTAPALLNTSVTVTNLTLEQNAAQVFNIFGNTLTVTGNLTSSPLAGVYTSNQLSGRVVMNGSGASTLSGFVHAPITIGPASGSCLGTYAISGQVQTFAATLNCPLDLGANFYNIAGPLNVTGAQARVTMTQAGATLITSSDALFQSTAQAGFLTAGTMSIGGKLTVNSAFSAGPNHTLMMPGGGTRELIIGANAGAVSIGNFIAGPNTTVPITSPSPFTVTGTFSVLGNMTVNAGTTISVGTAASFSPGSLSTISGTMAVTGSSLFSSGSSVTGAGTMTVVPATCTKQNTPPGAVVNVTGNGFTASPAQCTNQIP